MAEESGVDQYPHSVDESPWLCLISRVLPSREPPSEDPQARWCGEGGLNTRPYPNGTYLNGTYLMKNKNIFQSVRMVSDNDKFGAFSSLLIHMPTLQGRLNSEPAKCAIVTG